MLRKTSLIFLLMAVFSHPGFAGFYVGGSVGPEGARFNQKAQVTRLGTFSVIDRNHFAGGGVFGSIFAGYSMVYRWFYAAAEINTNWSSVEYVLSNVEFFHQTVSRTTFNINRSQGISFLPGWVLSDVAVVYARIGYANGHIKLHESDPTIHSARAHRDGIRYGIGLRYRLAEQLDFLMDYSQINYHGITGTVYEPFGEVWKRTKITSDTAQVAFGLVYRFDNPLIVQGK